MEKLLFFQEDLYSRILKAKTNFKKSPKDRLTKEYVEGKIDSVDQLWFKFLAGHEELMKTYDIVDIKNSSYYKNDVYDKCDDVYIDYKTELKTKLANFSVPSTSNDRLKGSGSTVKLPKVNINTFSGKHYTEWNSFRDLFLSLVHNNDDLDDVQKLLYLKGYLTGEAEQLLSNVAITRDNYSRAWKLLEDRYNNKRYISNHILKRLLSQRNIAQESASCLKELLDTTNDCLSSLSNLGVKTENWDILMIHIIALKLDPESRRQWEFSATESNSTDELPTYKQFQEFLTKRYRALEFLDSRTNTANKNQNRNNIPINKMKSMHITKTQCPFCSEEHTLNYCTAFKNNSVESRRSFVQSNNVCFCCLGTNHTAKNCKTNIKCRICSKRHHALLHASSEGNFQSNVTRTVTTDLVTDKDAELSSSSANDEELESDPIVSCFAKKHNSVLLATALVNTTSKVGECYTMRALLDQGSQSSFITEAVVQQLGLKKTHTKIQITGVGGDKTLVSKAVVDIQISSRIDPKVVFNVRAHVLNSITTLLPTNKIKLVEWEELQDIVLADPYYHCWRRNLEMM